LVRIILTSFLIFAFDISAAKISDFNIDNKVEWLAGDLISTGVSHRGLLELAPDQAKITGKLPGYLSAIISDNKGGFFVGTMHPAKLLHVSQDGKIKTLAEIESGIVSSVALTSDGRVAFSTTPKGAVKLIDPSGQRKDITIKVSKDLLLSLRTYGDKLYALAGGNGGELLQIDINSKNVKSLVQLKESALTSLEIYGKTRSPTFLFGSAREGIVYRFDGKYLKALVNTGLKEVTAIVRGEEGRIYAALIDSDANGDGYVSMRASHLENLKNEKEQSAPKIKRSQVVLILPDGRFEVLWQSKREAVYDLYLQKDEQKLLAATGPNGLLIDISPSGERSSGVILKSKTKGDIWKILPLENRMTLAMSRPSALIRVAAKAARAGIYESKIFDTKTIARLGQMYIDGVVTSPKGVKAFVRVGNTPKPDQTWSLFTSAENSKRLRGRYAQIQLKLKGPNKPKVRDVKLYYQRQNRPPRIGQVKLLRRGIKLKAELPGSKTVHSADLKELIVSELLPSDLDAFLPRVSQKVQVQYDPDYQSIQVFAGDADDDVLSYRYWLERLGPKNIGRSLLKDWSLNSFLSFNTAKLSDGRYVVHVEVDDLPSNTYRGLRDDKASTKAFRIDSGRPQFIEAKAVRKDFGVLLSALVQSKVPLAEVRCAVGGANWQLIEPLDGVVDGQKERFDVMLKGRPLFGAIACKATDENLKTREIQINVD